MYIFCEERVDQSVCFVCLSLTKMYAFILDLLRMYLKNKPGSYNTEKFLKIILLSFYKNQSFRCKILSTSKDLYLRLSLLY